MVRTGWGPLALSVLALLLGLQLCSAADNGRGLLPPMAWRSWNCFAADIDQAKIQAQVDALVKPRGPTNESLLALGWGAPPAGPTLRMRQPCATRPCGDPAASSCWPTLTQPRCCAGTIGIDEGWEGNVTEKNASKRCGAGINGSVVHYPNGTPAIGANFPDMAGLVRDARSKNVSMGWYFNGARSLC